MKKHLSKKRVVLAAIVAVALAIGSGVAYAYWTSGGTGSGAAAAGTTSGITVHQLNTVSGLYPGGSPVPLNGNFSNSNSAAVHIASVTATVTGVTGAGSDTLKPACTSADFAIGGSAAGSTVLSGVNVGAWSGLTVQLVDGAGNQDNCKGASATITYAATPAS